MGPPFPESLVLMRNNNEKDTVPHTGCLRARGGRQLYGDMLERSCVTFHPRRMLAGRSVKGTWVDGGVTFFSEKA